MQYEKMVEVISIGAANRKTIFFFLRPKKFECEKEKISFNIDCDMRTILV
jgi:hypothetical protein